MKTFVCRCRADSSVNLSRGSPSPCQPNPSGAQSHLNFALLYPNLVKRLIVVNSFSKFRSPAKLKLGIKLARVLPNKVAWTFRRIVSSVGLFVDRVPRNQWNTFFNAVRSVPQPAIARRLQLIAELDLDDRLSDIQVPTLLIGARNDLLLPSATEMQQMGRRMPNATVRLIEGAGHACLLGQKVSLARLISEWIGDEERGSGFPISTPQSVSRSL